ncbi:MAG TPA: hypothetical protein VKH44_05470, partial [Pirellulaceae bacterium]|nr:hypothetical protein [Pirellulaceae bacterium]
ASHAAWMNERLLALGCVIAPEVAASALLIRDASGAEPRLALQPGETAWIELSPDGTVLVEVPRRFDGLMAAWAALVVPTIARLSGLEVQASRRPFAMDPRCVQSPAHHHR